MCSVGGSLPVAFSYFCEFFSKKNRGPFVIILAGFWTFGSVFAAVMALAIIEHTAINVDFGRHSLKPHLHGTNFVLAEPFRIFCISSTILGLLI
jgi:MFS family permease